MAGLRLESLGWEAAGASFVLEMTVESGDTAVVFAAPHVGAALADVLLGLTLPHDGSVRVGDRDVTALPPGRRGIALVPAGGGLLPHLTVERNVAYAGGEALRWMRRLRLEAIARSQPHELSPVQRLQVALARALSTEPVAVVFEDRVGQVPCRTAVAEARRYTAVLVITDAEARGTTMGGVVRPEEVFDAT